MKDKLTFHNHPLKNEIIKRWDEGQSSLKINHWLRVEHSEVTLSSPTLAKHFKRYQFNKKRLDSADKKTPLKKREQSLVEDILWETIEQCRKMKKGKTISVKDWQYLDQQLQSAIEKLIRVSEVSGDSKDISTVLSDIFMKLEAGEPIEIDRTVKKEISEQEKLKITEEVDNEDKPKGEEELAA